MHYVKYFDILGVQTAQVPCIELQGVPTAATEGVVGLLGIDVTSESYELYKCVKVDGGVYTWESITRGKDGTSLTKAEVDINGELVLTLSNGTTMNVGKVTGERGESGTNGIDGTNGVDGVSVTGAVINEDGELVVTLSNGESINAGSVKGDTGVSIVKVEINSAYELIITLSNDTVINLGSLVLPTGDILIFESETGVKIGDGGVSTIMTHTESLEGVRLKIEYGTASGSRRYLECTYKGSISEIVRISATYYDTISFIVSDGVTLKGLAKRYYFDSSVSGEEIDMYVYRIWKVKE